MVCILALAWGGCEPINDPANPPEDSSKTTSSAGKVATSPSQKDDSSLKKAQTEAKSFFAAFSSALQRNDSAKALTLVAKDHQYRFGIAYPFWQGCRFYDAKVVKINSAGDLLQVQVSLEWPNGKKDREIKKLQRVKGKWRLMDS